MAYCGHNFASLPLIKCRFLCRPLLVFGGYRIMNPPRHSTHILENAEL